MEIKGLIVNDKKEVQYFMVQYVNSPILHSVSQMKKQVEFYSNMFDIKGVEIKDGALKLNQKFPFYQLEGIEKVRSIMNTLETNSSLRKELRGIDEEEVEVSISSNGSICVLKSFRNDEFFTDYDYDRNGYNDAEFIGWNIIPSIVAPYLDGVAKEDISCGGGEKLWFSVEVYCDKFAKLVEFK